jgi:hypothetical protein
MRALINHEVSHPLSGQPGSPPRRPFPASKSASRARDTRRAATSTLHESRIFSDLSMKKEGLMWFYAHIHLLSQQRSVCAVRGMLRPRAHTGVISDLRRLPMRGEGAAKAIRDQPSPYLLSQFATRANEPLTSIPLTRRPHSFAVAAKFTNNNSSWLTPPRIAIVSATSPTTSLVPQEASLSLEGGSHETSLALWCGLYWCDNGVGCLLRLWKWRWSIGVEHRQWRQWLEW